MIKIKDIMTKDVVTIDQGAGIVEASRLMASKSVSSLVVTENGKPVAVVSENDMIVGINSKKNKVKDIMKRDFMVVSPLTRFSEVEKSIRNKKVKRVRKCRKWIHSTRSRLTCK